MKIEMREIEPSKLYHHFQLTVREMTITELKDIVWHHMHNSANEAPFLCFMVALHAARTRFHDTSIGYVDVPESTSMTLVRTIVDNLGLSKRVMAVVNTAINKPMYRKSNSITNVSGAKAWRDYIRTISTDFHDTEIGIRYELVSRVMENNPDLVFPDMIYEFDAYKNDGLA